MKRIVNVFAFVVAFVLGTLTASLFWYQSWHEVPAVDERPIVEHIYNTVPPGPPEDLLGTWKGTWDHDSGDCTILIDRVDGNKFSGTLKKDGAVILFEGTFDPVTRYLQFNETKVVRLGAYSVWSLGKNIGNLSYDGRYLSGTGRDKWGEYTWHISRQ